ncbi:hypothetical protein VEx25_0098, partial [Vibrio antiquarius]
VGVYSFTKPPSFGFRESRERCRSR